MRWRAWFVSTTMAAEYIGIAAVIWLGRRATIRGELSAGEVVRDAVARDLQGIKSRSHPSLHRAFPSSQRRARCGRTLTPRYALKYAAGVQPTSFLKSLMKCA